MKPQADQVGRGLRTRRCLSLKSQTQVSALAFIALAMTGCETVRFGLSFDHDGTTLGASYGDGKTVVEAAQGDSRIRSHFSR
jgi:hypothetical protein